MRQVKVAAGIGACAKRWSATTSKHDTAQPGRLALTEAMVGRWGCDLVVYGARVVTRGSS